MYRSIDDRLQDLQQDRKTIDNYVEEIKTWFAFWELLEQESRQFFPLAEYLLDELGRVKETDYSPFIIQYSRILENELWKKAFIALHSRLKVYENHPYERRAFLYLDIISWLESKIENKPVAEIIRNKYLAEFA